VGEMVIPAYPSLHQVVQKIASFASVVIAKAKDASIKECLSYQLIFLFHQSALVDQGKIGIRLAKFA